MPSPAQQPHRASPLLNAGSNGQGAVQQSTPDEPDENNAIREGKERAKAVLAASNVSIGSGGVSYPLSGGMTSPSPGDAVNGASPSRKRSRSGSRKPSQSPVEEIPRDEVPGATNHLLQRYINRDQFACIAVLERDQHSVQITDQLNEDCRLYREWYGARRHQDPGSVFGYGYMGYGNGVTEIKGGVRLQYPMQAKRPGNRKSRPYPRVPREKLSQQTEHVEELVPLRLDIELDKIKLRDTLTWNLHDRCTDLPTFAENLVEDFRIPPEIRGHVIQKVERDIREQIQDYFPHACIDDEPLDNHLPYTAYKNDEMRILVKLNITIGQHTLVDQFEWDINNPQNSPEEFARTMACDLSLSGEFTTAIAHSIREQCQMFTKSLYITGHPFDGRPVEDTDVRDNFLPSPLPAIFRNQQSAKDYQPYLYELSEAELERAELSIMREQRRQKRSVTRRGGPALPDLKDRQRTVRTLIVSSVLPGAAETIEDSNIFKVTRSSKKSGGRLGRVNDDDSDDSDSDESIPESPAPAQPMSGTARTRGMRGAATVAQAAMRSALGRSATPEIAALHEGRASSRALRYEVREESVSEPTSLIVKLRINPRKFREYLMNPRAFARPAAPPVKAPTPPTLRSTPGASSMPPPPSPAMASRPNPAIPTEASPKPPHTPSPLAQGQRKVQYYPDGHVDAPFPAPTYPAPPPPAWVVRALEELQKEYPDDKFEGTMRYSILDKTNGKSELLKNIQLNPDGSLPPNYQGQFAPRIRCIDCPGKAYTAGPGLTVENFKVHLKNQAHRSNVAKRTG